MKMLRFVGSVDTIRSGYSVVYVLKIVVVFSFVRASMVGIIMLIRGIVPKL